MVVVLEGDLRRCGGQQQESQHQTGGDNPGLRGERVHAQARDTACLVATTMQLAPNGTR